MILALKIIIVVELWALLSSCCPPLLKRWLWLYSQDWPTKILTKPLWLPWCT